MAANDNSYCFACGENNPIGLHLDFKFDGDKLTTKKILPREYEGYKGIVHGGIVTTLLDEAMGNYIIQKYNENAVTGRLEIRYRHPTPIEQELTISAIQVSQRRNILTMQAEVATADGTVTAEATAKFAVVSLK